MADRILARFPGLSSTSFRVTSPATRDYNCIAWAANETARWWWPDPDVENAAAYWPDSVEREETIEAFMAAFAALGFTRTDDERVELGCEKIALFANGSEPTHAARQLPNGFWTSKLGTLEDIQHELRAIEGEIYGGVVAILRRPL